MRTLCDRLNMLNDSKAPRETGFILLTFAPWINSGCLIT